MTHEVIVPAAGSVMGTPPDGPDSLRPHVPAAVVSQEAPASAGLGSGERPAFRAASALGVLRRDVHGTESCHRR